MTESVAVSSTQTPPPSTSARLLCTSTSSSTSTPPPTTMPPPCSASLCSTVTFTNDDVPETQAPPPHVAAPAYRSMPCSVLSTAHSAPPDGATPNSKYPVPSIWPDRAAMLPPTPSETSPYVEMLSTTSVQPSHHRPPPSAVAPEAAFSLSWTSTS